MGLGVLGGAGAEVLTGGVALIRRATFSIVSNHKAFYDVAFGSSLGVLWYVRKVSFVKNALVFF